MNKIISNIDNLGVKVVLGSKKRHKKNEWGEYNGNTISIYEDCPKDKVYMTILHELGHHIQLKLGLPFNEWSADTIAAALTWPYDYEKFVS